MSDTISGPVEHHLRSSLEKIDVENLEDERKTRVVSFKKKAIDASTKFRSSLTKKGRRNSRVMSVVFEDEHDADEFRVADAFLQVLILEELLPSKHDDYHMLLSNLSGIFRAPSDEQQSQRTKIVITVNDIYHSTLQASRSQIENLNYEVSLP